MIKLNDILVNVPVKEVIGSPNVDVNGLYIDSREVKPGCLFAARKGTAIDSHLFIPAVISSGAVAILESNGLVQSS